MYNLLSLLMGLAAIFCSILSLKRKGSLLWCTVSGFFCGASLLCQLIDTERLSKIMDSSAIYDTAHGRVVAGVILLTVVTALNLAALLSSGKDPRS